MPEAPTLLGPDNRAALETAFLGGVIIDQHLDPDVQLQPADFADPALADLFAAVRKLAAPFDPVDILNALGTARTTRAEWGSLVTILYTDCPPRGHSQAEYATQIRDAAAADRDNQLARPFPVDASTEQLINTLKAGPVEDVFLAATMQEIAARPPHDHARIRTVLAQHFASKFSKLGFDRALKAAIIQGSHRTMRTIISQQTRKPIVQVNNQNEDVLRAAAGAALVRSNNPPTLFSRGDRLVCLFRDAQNATELREMNVPLLRARCGDAALWVRENDTLNVNYVMPPVAILEDLLAVPPAEVPAILGVTDAPFLRPDGSIRTEPGFDPVTQIYLAERVHVTVPDQPSQPERTEALDTVRALLQDFCFVDEASWANSVAAILTPLLTVAFGGSIPAWAVSAPIPSSGKSALAELPTLILTGRKTEITPPPCVEEEWPKFCHSVALAGRPTTILDNLETPLKSPSLNALITSSAFRSRILGETRQVGVAYRALWTFTGNNLALHGDLPRRAFWSKLDPKTSSPESQSHNWRWAMPEEIIVPANRTRFLSALLTLARAWFAAGKPPAPATYFSSFQPWADLVGGILWHAGIGNFLANLRETIEEADPELAEWREFFRARLIDVGSDSFSAGELVQWVRDSPAGQRSLPAGIEATGHGCAIRLGRALQKKRDRRLDSDGLRLVADTGDSHRHQNRWRVVTDH